MPDTTPRGVVANALESFLTDSDDTLYDAADAVIGALRHHAAERLEHRCAFTYDQVIEAVLGKRHEGETP